MRKWASRYITAVYFFVPYCFITLACNLLHPGYGLTFLFLISDFLFTSK